MGLPPRAVDSVVRTVGRTPLVRLQRYERAGGPRLFAKCEFYGPGNSIFDRAAQAVIVAAEHGGHLHAGRPIIAAGGTDASISLAMMGSASGHTVQLLVPKTLHPERRRALADYGAELIPVEPATGFEGAREQAFDLATTTGALYVDLFEGNEIVAAYEAIGQELVEALDHAPALTVCGLDLGAIPIGIARGLGGAPVVAVEPEHARIGSGLAPTGTHLLGGLAPGPAAAALDRTLVHNFEAIGDREAWDFAERLSRETGILAGIVSGAVLVAALRRAEEMTSGDVVAVLPDSGERRFMLAELFR